MKFDTNQLNTLIKSRRSTFPRQFAPGEKVDDAIIYQLLENANWAPTHKLTEPWRFTVFTGKGLQSFAQLQASVYKNASGDAFKEDNYQKLLTTPLLASHIISIGMKRHAEKNIPEFEEIAAVACAVQNMYLTAAAYEIGAYWSTGGVTQQEGVKPFFGLDAADKLMGFFYVGVIAVPSAPGQRGAIAEKVQWIR
ncbi:MAG TPA: nitroreductase [Chitinophagaceae bacterium]|nr:nitroreductase [Chitinophagaceae bacterium]